MGGRRCLTPLEASVLRLVAEGATDREVAKALDMGYHQVRHAARSAMAALSARSRAEAVYRAVGSGLLPLPEGDGPRICA